MPAMTRPAASPFSVVSASTSTGPGNRFTRLTRVPSWMWSVMPATAAST
jgi:hypothetical protein